MVGGRRPEREGPSDLGQASRMDVHADVLALGKEMGATGGVRAGGDTN